MPLTHTQNQTGKKAAMEYLNVCGSVFYMSYIQQMHSYTHYSEYRGKLDIEKNMVNI